MMNPSELITLRKIYHRKRDVLISYGKVRKRSWNSYRGDVKSKICSNTEMFEQGLDSNRELIEAVSIEILTLKNMINALKLLDAMFDFTE